MEDYLAIIGIIIIILFAVFMYIYQWHKDGKNFSILERVINLTRLKKERSYDVPNFMSQLMFIIPTDVKVTSITVGDDNQIKLTVESPKYAQLGYFVSRLKLAGIIKNVDMEVTEMSSDIKIIVKGELPW